MTYMRKLYDWVLAWANRPSAEVALFVLALTESFIFPIPPDVLLIAMAVALPQRAFKYALICLVGSLLGGAIGYGIGAFFMDGVGMPIVHFYGAEEQFLKFRELYRDSAIFTIALAGFTPIPYKIFSFSSGAFDVGLMLFITVSLFSRGARFFLVALLIFKYGAKVRQLIERHFNTLTLAFGVLLVLGFVVVRWIF